MRSPENARVPLLRSTVRFQESDDKIADQFMTIFQKMVAIQRTDAVVEFFPALRQSVMQGNIINAPLMTGERIGQDLIVKNDILPPPG